MKSRSIRTTLMIGLAAIALTTTTGFAGVVYLRARHVAHAGMREKLEIRAESLAQLIELNPLGVELEIPPELMANFSTPGSGAYFILYGPDGAVIGKSPSLGEQALPPPTPGTHKQLITEIPDGPDGFPCAGIELSFVPSMEKSEYAAMGLAPPEPENCRLLFQVALDSRERDGSLATLATFLAVTGAAIVALTLISGLWLAHRLLAPIRRMTGEAENLTAADPDRRLKPETVVRELDSLAGTLNSAFDRLADALERQRRFTSDASHELRTPVTVLLGNTELMLRRPRTTEEYRSGLERQHRVALRMKEITENLLTLARADAVDDGIAGAPVDLGRIVAGICEEFRPLAAARNVLLECASEPESLVRGDTSYLSQLTSNLISNAVKFTPDGGVVRVEVESAEREVRLTVADTGEGLTPEETKHVFERFYRAKDGKDRREGAGLGLAIVDWIVKAHHGDIAVESRPGKGTTFLVRLLSAAVSRPPSTVQPMVGFEG